MGVALGVLGGEAHLGQDLLHLLLPLGAAVVHVVDVQAFGDDVPHLLAGVQAGHGVLEDHLHLGAQAAACCSVQMAADVLAVKGDLPRGGVIQPDDAAADGGFARAGLPHQAVGLAGIDGEADVVHRLHREIAADAEILFEALDFQQRGLVFVCHVWGSSFAAALRASAFIRSMRARSSAGISTLGARGSSSQVAA